MALHSIDMFRRLGSGVRPDGARPKPGTRPFESLSFSQMLSGLGGESRPSGRPVHLPDEIELDLDDETREAVSFALDRAEAKNIERLLAVTGAGVLVLDVPTRTVRSAESAPDDEVMSGIDGAVVLGGLAEGSEPRGATSEEMARGLRRLGSASLVRVLAQGEQQH